MSESKPTASEVNTGQILSFPLKRSLSITLEVEIPDAQAYEYFLTPVGSEVQIGFIADLWDIIGFGSEIPLKSINGLTLADIQKRMGHFT